MIRILKTLGLALVASLAMSAAVAMPASAEMFVFTSNSEHTTLNGEQVGESTLTVDGGSVSCSEASFSGTMTEEAAAEITFSPTYEDCIAFGGFASAELDMNSCDYVFAPLTKEGSNYEVEAWIECAEEGDSIVITAKSAFNTLKCVVHVDEQTVSGNVTASEASGDITVDLSLEGVKYDQTAGTGFGACASAENTTNGTYEGHVTVNGGEASLALAPIPHTIEILTDPIKFAKQGDKVAFEIQNREPKLVDLKLFITPPGVQVVSIMGGCKKTVTLAKKGDKGDRCKEELECVTKMNKNDAVFLVLTDPVGGSKVRVEGC